MDNPLLAEKLASLPKEPGIYFHKDASGQIIYIGKAAVLRNRVRQYFQKSRVRDVKTDALVAEICDIDWMVVDSELEALFLEAEMVRRYLPRYNILLRDDKSMNYIRIDYDSSFPTVSTTRRPLDDGARYFGPYNKTTGVRQALQILRRIFPYSTSQIVGQKRATLHYHLGLDPGLEEGHTSLSAYRTNLRRLMSVIEGQRKSIETELTREMKALSKISEFEKAAKVRNQLFALQSLSQKVIFSDKEFLDISKDHALNELVELLSLEKFPRRIEGYDISHMQGTNVVASMVVFSNGVSNKSEYRKFKTRKDENNDFFNMHETIFRRFSEKNINTWGKPNLVLIDGGKGQLDAAIRARNEQGYHDIPFIGLAKRQEQIVIQKYQKNCSRAINLLESGPTVEFDAVPLQTINASRVNLNYDVLSRLEGFTNETDDFILVTLPHSTNLIKLLQRIRDESHRFAVSYHSLLKNKQQTSSLLDEIPGIGPLTRKKLLKKFGSLKAITEASEIDIITLIGKTKYLQLSKYVTDKNHKN